LIHSHLVIFSEDDICPSFYDLIRFPEPGPLAPSQLGIYL
jgi:hypothetical protein